MARESQVVIGMDVSIGDDVGCVAYGTIKDGKLIIGRILYDGYPCGHPGCLSHISHPCEGCGRIGGRATRETPSPSNATVEQKEFWLSAWDVAPIGGFNDIKGRFYDVQSAIEWYIYDNSFVGGEIFTIANGEIVIEAYADAESGDWIVYQRSIYDYLGKLAKWHG